jgi:hypothetical protein
MLPLVLEWPMVRQWLFALRRAAMKVGLGVLEGLSRNDAPGEHHHQARPRRHE